MCGIAGMAALHGTHAPALTRLQTMCRTITHRGPDDEGTHIEAGVALGMRRLSIIDLAGGHQPIFNEDRSIRTVFNGEIYNFRELRAQLQARSHVFSTNSDTEVIVHAYEEYGVAFPAYLNGMFAIALHDAKNRRLCLVRDHIGIKPLYYSVGRDYLVWGSEIKVLLASGVVPRELDVDGLGQFMAWEYVPGEQTLLKSVRKLEPGKMLEVDLINGRCTMHEYWDVPPVADDQGLSVVQWEEAVDAKIHECVQRQMVSDVPLGAFLSGGVDSSLVVASMGEARTFSIGFDDSTYNELPFAQEVARHLGVDHHSEIIEPEVAHLFEKIIYMLDDPIGDFSVFPTYLVSQVARNHVTVALSGDGGDELFGGYETYLADEKARQYGRIPVLLRRGMIEPWVKSLRPRAAKKGIVNKAKRFIEGVEFPDGLSHARWRLFVGEAMRDQLFTSTAREQMPTAVGQHIINLFQRAGVRQAVSKSLYVDVKSYLVDNILTKVDRMSMAVSLETRVPLLDKELVELAFRVPDNLKIHDGKTKVLLKRVASRHVPRRCVYRPKEGFSIPIKKWLATQFRPMMEELLSAQRIRTEGLFDWPTVERLKVEHLGGRANHSHILWSLMVFQAWRDKWLCGSPPVTDMSGGALSGAAGGGQDERHRT